MEGASWRTGGPHSARQPAGGGKSSTASPVNGGDGAGAGIVALLVSALCCGVFVLGRSAGQGISNFDFYGYYYPNTMHAWDSLRAGSGLLWNPYQDCGQPLFATSQSSLLSHEKFLFVLFDRNTAFVASAVLNLSIAAIGTFLLCRSLGLGAVAALCGALALQLGLMSWNFALWTPVHSSSFAWLPVAAWLTERLVRAPGGRSAAYLGVVLTLQILTGFVQLSFFTYQLVALRIAWALLCRQSHQPLRLLVAAGGAMVLPLLLGAAQLVPSFEVARESLRNLPLRPSDISGGFSWPRLGDYIRSQVASPGNFLPFLLAFLSPSALRDPRRRAAVAFFLLVAVGYAFLSLGPGSPLYTLYELLPLGTAFRGAARLLWVATFALAILAAFGADALLAAGRRPLPWSVATVAGALLLNAATAGGLRVVDWVLAAIVTSLPLLFSRVRPAGAVALLLPLLSFVNGIAFTRGPLLGLRDGDIYDVHRQVFTAVRHRLSAQDRVQIIGKNNDFALMPRSAMIFRIPSIYDYEVQVSRRYAEFFTYMRTRRPLRGVDDFYWLFGKLLPPTLDRRLFDLTAARYLIVDADLDRTGEVLAEGLTLLSQRDGVRLYENTHALPRARFVARALAVPPEEVLATLTQAGVDLRQVAVLDRAPLSGFLGGAGDAMGEVELTVDEAERVVARVRAPQAGFLFLADQYFPGWRAEVNGAEREILRADHAFRAVEVPSGESTVVFTCRPRSAWIGAVVSLLTMVGLVIAPVLRRGPRGVNGRALFAAIRRRVLGVPRCRPARTVDASVPPYATISALTRSCAAPAVSFSSSTPGRARKRPRRCMANPISRTFGSCAARTKPSSDIRTTSPSAFINRLITASSRAKSPPPWATWEGVRASSRSAAVSGTFSTSRSRRISRWWASSSIPTPWSGCGGSMSSRSTAAASKPPTSPRDRSTRS